LSRVILAIALLLPVFPNGVCAALPPVDLTDLSLEELMNLRVTSTARRPQSVAESPTAVFVITQDDIRRSGATSIPEALRMAPGVDVARIDANKWAISVRGFNGRFANKLLVMIDGRSVYTPLTSGVLWDAQDTVLEDIDRIEVVRGPGASLWGANAVNGVINIVTKQARDTQGGLFVAGAGTEEQGFTTLRYGGQFNEDTFYRAYVKYFNRDSQDFIGGGDAADDWQVGRSGFRLDWQPEGPDAVTVQGDIYRGVVGTTGSIASLGPPFAQTLSSDDDIFGANLLSRWTHEFEDGSDMQLQVYYDLAEAEELGVDVAEHTFDVDFQHHFQMLERHDIVWGLGARLIQGQFDGTFTTGFSDSERTDYLLSAFLQDEITLVPDELRLTLGSKFEYNSFTGFEFQPTGRLIWTPDDRQAIWGAVSRATRTPSQSADSISINSVLSGPDPANPFPNPLQLSVLGNPDEQSEEVTALELGYRVRPTDELSFDVAGFYNIYDNLLSVETQSLTASGAPPPFPNIFCFVFALPGCLITGNSQFDNLGSATTYGVEASADWRVAPWWRLQGAYTFLHVDIDHEGAAGFTVSANGRDPAHVVSVRSSWDIAENWEFDVWGRYVSDLPERGVENYFTFDARLGWRPFDGLELAIVGQNLFDGHHLEFTPELINTTPTEVERSVYGKVTVTF
jgi:iron complex outermembrane receptor protein